jgi:hypothetical protein
MDYRFMKGVLGVDAMKFYNMAYAMGGKVRKHKVERQNYHW